MVSGRLTRLSGGSGMGTGAAPALARQDPGPRAPGSQTALCSPYEWAVAGAEPCHSVWRGPHLTLPTAVPQSWLSPRGNSPPPPSARPETACAVLCRDPCPLGLQKGVRAGPPGGQAGQVRGANAKTLRQAPGPRHHSRAHAKRSRGAGRAPRGSWGDFLQARRASCPPTHRLPPEDGPIPLPGPHQRLPQRRLNSVRGHSRSLLMPKPECWPSW